MKTPKLLPWIARRAGISDKRAEFLWTRAVAAADRKYGVAANNSDYWHFAMTRLLDLASQERMAHYAMGALPNRQDPMVPFRYAVQFQTQVNRITLDMASEMTKVTRKYWTTIFRQHTA